MFRRLPHTLPKDPVISTTLSELGYFITPDDQIRQIKKPEQKYQFLVNRNDRVSDVYKEAMNTMVRHIVKERLEKLGFETVRVPLDASETDPHTPIYVSPNLARKKRVITVFGERNQDPTVFSYRVTGDEGINIGSIIHFAQSILHSPSATSDDDIPGIIFTNPCQLYWYRGESRAVSWSEWVNLPRASAVDEPFRVDPIKNTIPGNRDFREHVSYIFNNVLTSMVHPEAQLDIIGLEWTGTAALECLAKNWQVWGKRVNGICFGGPQHKVTEVALQSDSETAIINFIAKRTRAYFVSDEPLEAMLPGRDEFGCNRYSSGEKLYQENVILRSWPSMLDWFNMIHTLPDFEEIEVELEEEVDQELSN